ncbi:hypothetical protein ACQEVF_22770 [Nonomuraea polychroma]|uniref:hypothetical protein n=1 Tax=Nonomuraea polychroma TaxID=46176 RepID=UPI003D8B2809
MARKYAAALAGVAAAAAVAQGFAAAPANAAPHTQVTAAAQSAGDFKAQLRSADGYCVVPRGRQLKVLKCKPGQWLWHVGKVDTTVKGFSSDPTYMFRYADPEVVSSEGWWCMDSDGEKTAFMSLCSSKDRGQLWIGVGGLNVGGAAHVALASVKKLDKSNGDGAHALRNAAVLQHNGTNAYVGCGCPDPRAHKLHWRWS